MKQNDLEEQRHQRTRSLLRMALGLSLALIAVLFWRELAHRPDSPGGFGVPASWTVLMAVALIIGHRRKLLSPSPWGWTMLVLAGLLAWSWTLYGTPGLPIESVAALLLMSIAALCSLFGVRVKMEETLPKGTPRFYVIAMAVALAMAIWLTAEAALIPEPADTPGSTAAYALSRSMTAVASSIVLLLIVFPLQRTDHTKAVRWVGTACMALNAGQLIWSFLPLFRHIAAHGLTVPRLAGLWWFGAMMAATACTALKCWQTSRRVGHGLALGLASAWAVLMLIAPARIAAMDQVRHINRMVGENPQAVIYADLRYLTEDAAPFGWAEAAHLQDEGLRTEALRLAAERRALHAAEGTTLYDFRLVR